MIFYFSSILLMVHAVAASQCPSEQVYIDKMNACVAVMKDGTKYGEYQALANCHAMGGDLTSIHNAFENTMIFSLLLSNHVAENAFIGGNRQNGQWGWTDGSQMSYTNWGNGEPAKHNDCMQMSKDDGTWVAADCSGRNAYFCSIPLSTDCPSGWKYFKGNCYLFNDWYPARHSWSVGNKYCQSVGAFGRTKNCETAWIGLQYNNGYAWTDGSPVNFNNASEKQNHKNYMIYPSCYDNSRVGRWDCYDKDFTQQICICKKGLNNAKVEAQTEKSL